MEGMVGRRVGYGTLHYCTYRSGGTKHAQCTQLKRTNFITLKARRKDKIFWSILCTKKLTHHDSITFILVFLSNVCRDNAM